MAALATNTPQIVFPHLSSRLWLSAFRPHSPLSLSLPYLPFRMDFPFLPLPHTARTGAQQFLTLANCHTVLTSEGPFKACSQPPTPSIRGSIGPVQPSRSCPEEPSHSIGHTQNHKTVPEGTMPAHRPGNTCVCTGGAFIEKAGLGPSEQTW